MMKNIKILKRSLTITAFLWLALSMVISTSSCSKDWDDEEKNETVEMTANTTIAELKAMYKGSPVTITDESIIVDARVISTDKYGNFYRSFYVEDETGGLEIKLGKTGIYNDYHEGQTIYIKPNLLTLGAYNGTVNLGYASQEEKYETAYIDVPVIIKKTIFAGATGDKVEPKVITSSGLVDSNIGCLVTFENATYKEGGYYNFNTSSYVEGLSTWAVKDDPTTSIEENYSGDQVFSIDAEKTVTVRTSSYSKFAESAVPTVGTKCNVTGILTKYVSGGGYVTWQIILNRVSDVEEL